MYIIYALSFPSICIPQEEAGNDEPEQISPSINQEEASDIIDVMSKGFKKALNEINMEKAIEKAESEQKISAALDNKIQEWTDLQSSGRSPSINSSLEQIEYSNYYLRDFSYSVQGKNIIETSSIIYPYEADVNLLDLMYVEQAPLIAEPRSNYQYTLATYIHIKLLYNKQGDSWDISNAQPVNTSLSKGWPSQIRKKLGQYFIPSQQENRLRQ